MSKNSNNKNAGNRGKGDKPTGFGRFWPFGEKTETDPADNLLDARRLDYRYAQDDPFMFIKGDGVWTGVILRTTSGDFTSGEEQLQAAGQNSMLFSDLSNFFLHSYKMDEVITQRVTKYVPVDASQWEKQYLDNTWDPSKLFISLIQSKVSPHLAETAPERREYLFIRLGDFGITGKPDPLSAILGHASGVVEEVFTSQDLNPWRQRALQVQSVVEAHGAVPMDRSDLMWLMRKTLMGHFPVDEATGITRSRPWRGGFFDEVVNITADVGDDYVVVSNPDPGNGWEDKTYITTAIIEYTEPVIPFEYSGAWGSVLRRMNRPVDVVWPATIISADKWAKMAKNLSSKVLDEAKVRDEVGAQTSERFEQKVDAAQELNSSLELGVKPVAVHQQRLTYAAPTLEELTKLTTDLVGLFGDNVNVRRPNGDQGFLLESQLPGDMPPPTGRRGRLSPTLGRLFMSDFTKSIEVEDERWTDLEALGYARLDSSTLVGDSVEYRSGKRLGWYGPPIGYARDTGTVVHFDPAVQMSRNKGAGTIIIGASGGGKSSLALTLFFWLSESGTQCIVIDPKNDFQNFVHFLAFGKQVLDDDFDDEVKAGILGGPDSRFQPVNPRFWAETSVVALSNGGPGMLDPWAIADTYAGGEAAARDVVHLIVRDEQDRKYVDAAFQAMRDRHSNEETSHPPSLAELAEHMGQEVEHYEAITNKAEASESDKMTARDRMQAVRSVQDQLTRAGDREFGRTMFGRAAKGVEPFTIKDRRRVIVTLLGMTPPDSSTDVDDWDDTARDGAAAMLLVLRAIQGFFSNSKPRLSPRGTRHGLPPRVLFVDEAYVVTALKAGRQLLRVIARQGRSLFFGLILLSQQARDINELEEEKTDDEASTNQFPTKFVFRQGGTAEARDALRLLKPSVATQLSTEERQAMENRLLEPGNGGEMETGVCAMCDVDNRVAMVQVDRLFEEIVSAAETNTSIGSSMRNYDPSARGEDWSIMTELRDMLRTGVVTSEVSALREALSSEGVYEYDEYGDVLTTTA